MSNIRELDESELQHFVGGHGGRGTGKCFLGLVGGGTVGGLEGAASLSGFGPAGITIGGLYGTLGGILSCYAATC